MTEVEQLITQYGEEFVGFCVQYVEGSLGTAYGGYGIPKNPSEKDKKEYKKYVDQAVCDKERSEQMLAEFHEREYEELPESFKRESEELEKKMLKEEEARKKFSILIPPVVENIFKHRLDRSMPWFMVFCVSYVVDALGNIPPDRFMDSSIARRLENTLDRRIIESVGSGVAEDEAAHEEDSDWWQK